MKWLFENLVDLAMVLGVIFLVTCVSVYGIIGSWLMIEWLVSCWDQ